MKRRAVLGIGLLTWLLVGVAPVVRADTSDTSNVSNFVINNFDADYTLGTTDPQGTLAIQEQLTVTFNDYNHGILRALPKKFQGSPQHIAVQSIKRDGVTEPYTTFTSNGNEVLKIGLANQTITGQHRYQIDYSVRNVVHFAGKQAELNWNVNGTEWQQPFEHVSARLHVPASLAGKLSSSRCFSGAAGSTASDCTATTVGDVLTYTTNRELHGGETLTFNDELPTGYFSAPTLKDKLSDNAGQLAVGLSLPILALLLAGGTWYRTGRDAKGRGTVIPEYGPPADLRPAEMDVILHNKLGKNAISATIIDLAIRKYLRIQEVESDGILGLGKHKSYSLVRLPEPTTDSLQFYEAQIYSRLFSLVPTTTLGPMQGTGLDQAKSTLSSLTTSGLQGGLAQFITKITSQALGGTPVEVGQAVAISSLKTTFYPVVKTVTEMIPSSLTARGYFRSNPASVGTIWHAAGILLFFGAAFLWRFGVLALIGAILAGIICIAFGSLMPSRTTQGAAAKDASEGLKLYLNTAEKDRLVMLQSPEGAVSQSAEPVKTVELFEKLLPYAMILRVEKQWAGKFRDIYQTPPDWYSGNWSNFNALYLADSLSHSMSAMNSSFAAPSSSGGGGSAGGGGGGGGGGGW